MAALRTAQVVRRFAFEEWGGTESVVWNSSLALAASGVGVEILSTRACSFGGDEVRDGIPIRRFPCFYPVFPLGGERRLALDKKGGSPYSPGLFRALAGGEYDILHVHTLGRIGQMAAAAARRRGRPFVLSFHGGCFDVPAAELERMRQPLRGTFNYGAITDRLLGWRRDLIADSGGIICVGENELEELRRRYPGKRIIYLPNGIDPELFRRPSPVDIYEYCRIPADRRLLLCVSRIDFQKNQLTLLKLAARILEGGGNPHVLLIGPVTDFAYRDELEAAARRLGLHDRFTLIPGAEPGGDLIRAALHRAEVFVLPSIHEPFGIVVLEAWSAGVPVLASRVGGLRYLVRDGENGILAAPEDIDGFYRGYRRLVAEPETRARLVAAAGRDVEAYAWPKIAAKLAEFYETVLAENRCGR